jgi:hypothetical protein
VSSRSGGELREACRAPSGVEHPADLRGAERPAGLGGVVRPVGLGGVVRPVGLGGVVRPVGLGGVVRPAGFGGERPGLARLLAVLATRILIMARFCR